MERPLTIVMDTVTLWREVAHGHFAPGDAVLVVRGSLDGSLTGDRFTVVASSWHRATGVNGWRLRDASGGEQSFVTAAPKYLIHIGRPCGECVDFFNALKEWVLPVLPEHGAGETHSFTLTRDAELVHVADEVLSPDSGDRDR